MSGSSYGLRTVHRRVNGRLSRLQSGMTEGVPEYAFDHAVVAEHRAQSHRFQSQTVRREGARRIRACVQNARGRFGVANPQREEIRESNGCGQSDCGGQQDRERILQ